MCVCGDKEIWANRVEKGGVQTSQHLSGWIVIFAQSCIIHIAIQLYCVLCMMDNYHDTATHHNLLTTVVDLYEIDV